MHRHIDIIVIALSQDDAYEWYAENPELADAATAFVVRSWEDLKPSTVGAYATTYVLTERAAASAAFGGTEAPRWMRIAAELTERRRPAYLRVAA